MNTLVKWLVVFSSVVVVVIGILWIRKAVEKKKQTKAYQQFTNIQNPVRLRSSSGQETIFVSIASYRDSELAETVCDLFDKALHPENIYVGICQQNLDGIDNDFWTDFHKLQKSKYHYNQTLKYKDHIQILRMHASESTGPTLARHLIETELMQDEKYTLIIDAHMMFSLNWDAHLIRELSQVIQETKSNRCILSTYPEGFNPNDRETVAALLSKQVAKNKHALSIYKHADFMKSIEAQDKKYFQLCNQLKPIEASGQMCFEQFSKSKFPEFVVKKFNNENGNVSKKGIEPVSDKPTPTPYWAGCFSFTLSQTHRVIPYLNVPYLFIGEEFAMAALYYTHGYQIFTPTKMYIRHQWDRSYRPLFWNSEDYDPNKKDESYDLLNKFFLVKPRNTMVDNPRMLQYGLVVGSHASISDYLKYSGIDLFSQTAEARSKLGLIPLHLVNGPDNWVKQKFGSKYKNYFVS